MLDLPTRGKEPCIDDLENLYIHSDASDMCTYAQSAAIDSRIPEKPIRKSPNVWKPQNSTVSERPRSRTKEPQRLKIISDASCIRTHAQSVRINAKTTAKTAEDVSITSNKQKQHNSPIGAKIWRKGEVDCWGNHADGLTVCTDVHSNVKIIIIENG